MISGSPNLWIFELSPESKKGTDWDWARDRSWGRDWARDRSWGRDRDRELREPSPKKGSFRRFWTLFPNSAKLIGGLGPWVVFQRERTPSSGPGFSSGFMKDFLTFGPGFFVRIHEGFLS